MEVKYTVKIKHDDGTIVNAAYKTNKETVTKFVAILLDGEDPNDLTDIVIRPEIDK